MNLNEFDATEPLCKFGPGGDFTVPYPADKPNTWVSLMASTRDKVTRITIKLPFLMTQEELDKLTSDLDRATMAISEKYLGHSVREIWMNFDD